MNKIYERLSMLSKSSKKYDDFFYKQLEIVTWDTDISRADNFYMSVRLLRAKFCVKIAFPEHAKDAEVKHAIENGKKCLMQEIFSGFDTHLNKITMSINYRDAEGALKSVADFRKFIYG